MTARTWLKGPPLHVGFWNASYERRSHVWRWWNGENWSIPIYQNTPPENLIFLIRSLAEHKAKKIEWTDYWPPNARIARINPDTGECTGNGPIPPGHVAVTASGELVGAAPMMPCEVLI